MVVLGILGEFLVDSGSPILDDARIRLVCFLAAGLLYLLWAMSDFMTILERKPKVWKHSDAATVGTEEVDNKEVKSTFVSIWQPGSPIQAGMIRDALEQANINCYVNNEVACSARFGGVSLGAGGMAVMVPENEVGQARQILVGLGVMEHGGGHE